MNDKRCQIPQLVTWYRQFLDDGKSAAFVSIVVKRYSISTLQRLTRSPSFEIRRAAVLALGMVGGAESLSHIGRCLSDDDRCVRLVAEVAFIDLSRRQVGVYPAQLLDKAKRHIDGERFDQAHDLLDSILAAWPTFAEALYQRGVAKFCLDEFNDAAKDGRQAIKLNKFHFAAHALCGRCCLELDRPSGALREFRRSFDLNPSQALVRGYIDVLVKQQRRLNLDDPAM